MSTFGIVTTQLPVPDNNFDFFTLYGQIQKSALIMAVYPTRSPAAVRAYCFLAIRLNVYMYGVAAYLMADVFQIFVEQLNHIQTGGFKLGFWFAQQGSIYVFIALIYIYSRKMARLERKYGLDDE